MRSGNLSVQLHSIAWMGALLLALTASALPSAAQEPSAPATSTDQQASLAVLQSLNASQQPYRIGRGDVVSINVEGRPELTGKQTVGPDGAVVLPVAGSLVITEMSRDQAAETIRVSLLKYYVAPVVTVSVEAYNSNRILLVGSVEHPGMLTFDHQPSLLEVLARGGSIVHGRPGAMNLNTAGGTNNASPAETMPDRCIIYRGTQTVITLDVKQLIATGSVFANFPLQRDDTVYIPAQKESFVSLLGQVQHPGSQSLVPTSTLASMIADAGGLARDAGNNPRIQIIEPSTGNKREVEFKALLNPVSSEIRLRAGDIVYVPTSGFNSFGLTLERLSPLVSVFTTSALLLQR